MQTLEPEPFRQFGGWYRSAVEAGVAQPEAMAVATADASGRPSVRMVLLKGWGERGFEFFTNLESQKGAELAANPQAALTLYWHLQGRQVRAAGPVSRVSRRESQLYWQSRPVASQASASVSAQSRPLQSWELLERRQAQILSEAGAGPLALPDSWGGFRLRPRLVEFWEHRDDRLHRRFLYTRRAGAWTLSELQP